MFLEPSIDTCPLVRRCQTAASQSSRSQHHHHGRLIWTEPARYWRKACRLACLNHTVLLQIIMAMSPTLHSIIVLADDPRGRRPKASSTLNHIKKRLSLSIFLKCPDLGYLIRIKFIPSLAYSITRYRPTTERPLKAPSHN